MVNLIDTIEGIHSQLRELGQMSCVHAIDVDRISNNLPRSTQMEWLRRYRDLPSHEKLSPFSQFVYFLKRERAAVARLAETISSKPTGKYAYKEVKGKSGKSDSVGSYAGQGFSSSKSCAVHGEGHSTEDCRTFKTMNLHDKYEVLKKTRRCFNCFLEHPRDQCTSPSCKCGKSHHEMLCSSSISKTEDIKTIYNW